MIITTQLSDCPLNKQFLTNLKALARRKGHNLYVIQLDVGTKVPEYTLTTDVNYILEDCEREGVHFKVSGRKPQQSPLLGVLPKGNMTIVASPIQWLKTQANAHGRAFIASTGTISDYEQCTYDKYPFFKAMAHYVLGAIVIEKDTIRNVRASAQGEFYDLGLHWAGGKPCKTHNNILVAGDWHTGSTRLEAKKHVIELIKQTRVNKLFVHDIFDGLSVNHHLSQKPLAKVRASTLTLKDEINACKAELEALARHAQVYVVKSNHDEFLDKYLAGGIFDPYNLATALKLGADYVEGLDPLYTALGTIKNVTYLGREDRVVKNYTLLSLHGDKGTNGSKGTVKQFDNLGLKVVIGHSHSPNLLTNAVQVGTSTQFDLDYTSGSLSTWAEAHALVHCNYVQLICYK